MMKRFILLAAISSMAFMAKGQKILFSLTVIDKVVHVYMTPTATITAFTPNGIEFFVEYPSSETNLTFGPNVTNQSSLPGIVFQAIDKTNTINPNCYRELTDVPGGTMFSNVHFGATNASSATQSYTGGIAYEMMTFTISNNVGDVPFHLRGDNVNGRINNGGYTVISDNISGLDFEPTDGSDPFTNGTLISGTTSSFVTPVSTVLPVVFANFTAAVNNCMTKLAWETSVESNSDHYDIETALDAINFVKVGQLTSKNSSNGASYTFSYGITTGSHAFRLKAVDKDGRYMYSGVILVNGTDGCKASVRLEVKVSPNPASNVLNVSGLETGSHMVLFNGLGREITNIIATGTNQSIDISIYAKGVYILRVEDPAGNVTNLKVMKQ